MAPLSRALLLFVLIFAALSARAAPPSAPDYAHAPALRMLLHWSRLPVRACFLPGPLATDTRRKAVLTGFDRWTLTTGGRISYTVVDSVKIADITVDFDPHAALPGTGNVSGHTIMLFSGTVLRKAQMMLAVGSVESDDLSNTAAHEFGHALGIDGHSDNSADLMYPELTRIIYIGLPSLPTLPRLPSARDVNTLRLCYPSLLADVPNVHSR